MPGYGTLALATLPSHLYLGLVSDRGLYHRLSQNLQSCFVEIQNDAYFDLIRDRLDQAAHQPEHDSSSDPVTASLSQAEMTPQVEKTAPVEKPTSSPQKKKSSAPLNLEEEEDADEEEEEENRGQEKEEEEPPSKKPKITPKPASKPAEKSVEKPAQKPAENSKKASAPKVLSFLFSLTLKALKILTRSKRN